MYCCIIAANPGSKTLDLGNITLSSSRKPFVQIRASLLREHRNKLLSEVIYVIQIRVSLSKL
ncbi:hypothetical protein KDAU_00300 [Dictyobacter aurantiacus]|uniref:Uncharacterized protein n=1 Tax=Dictyobacter aurantiacus TaxID=1936993 RepID=A0A401Z771_9CHLR|nr:hypothetical protein KDAU_00300 [Dictyobacter aurantiacus]